MNGDAMDASRDASTTDASTRNNHANTRTNASADATTNTSPHTTTNISPHANTNKGTNASATQEPTPASATVPTPAARTPAPARWRMGQDKLDDERPNTNTTANGPPPAR